MRTTLDIDDLLLRRLRDEAHARGVSFKEILDRVIRRGLQQPSAKKPAQYICPTFSMGEPLRSVDKALAVADALDDDERGWKLAQRK
jgi:hypothetical protein